MVHRNLHGRISGEQIATKDVVVSAGCQEDPVRITDDDVVLDYITRTRAGETDAEVSSLRRVAISAEPVLTEPIVAGATGQSYTSTRIAEVSVSN